MELQFLGGVGTVTGSRYLISSGQSRLLVDCGLYQGVKTLRKRNWNRFPVDPATLDAVVLSHAHIDHSGYAPALVKQGFRGRIYATAATCALCRVLLPDAGFLQEEDARYANRKKYSRHRPAAPLFTELDARKALEQFEAMPFQIPFEPVPGLRVRFTHAGHILGSACVHVTETGTGRTLVFSGDIGRQRALLMDAPEPIDEASVLVCESTYGDRLHPAEDPEDTLAAVIGRTVERGGLVLIPAFAVGRAQAILYLIHKLIGEKRIPSVPVFLNSPMAIRATEIFCHFHKEHRLTPEQCALIDDHTTYVRTVDESIALNRRRSPCVIVSASGMASGGRVLHHLKTLLPDPRNSVIFAGFQAPGTRGDALVSGVERVKIHGEYWPVKAEILNIDTLSAHADYQEILDWLGQGRLKPEQVYLTHGEPLASDLMRRRIEERFGWKADVPDLYEVVSI
ncbi:MBL fold metallo-hydrolase [Marinobacter sp. NFXS9]|uniref:MBL fold metallo-hydrolase n=1 Tax=Marinobacter sp. NFXS9 TaxID=2818433 RepID=UPI0032DEB155